MTLGEIVKQYRNSQSMSQRQFAAKSGLSNSYVSMLEQNINSKNGQPIAPSLDAIRKVATVIGTTVDDILHQIGDSPVDISGKPTVSIDDELNEKIMKLVRQLPEDKKLSLLDLLQSVVDGVRSK